MNNLQRFIDAQANTYSRALAEVRDGRKQGHWIWFIFPQITGLGFSETSKFYAIASLEEAVDYLRHPILGPRLEEISQALMDLPSNNAMAIFGSPDNLKLKSSMTLFAEADASRNIFANVLQKFFRGEKDENTIMIIRNQRE